MWVDSLSIASERRCYRHEIVDDTGFKGSSRGESRYWIMLSSYGEGGACAVGKGRQREGREREGRNREKRVKDTLCPKTAKRKSKAPPGASNEGIVASNISERIPSM